MDFELEQSRLVEAVVAEGETEGQMPFDVEYS